jgi:hypothetical protein
MKIAYLAFIYKNPRLLKRTIEHLSCKDSAFFIHVDLKSNLDEFAAIHGPNVYFLKQRIPVYWAEFSGNRAIMLLIKEALAARKKYDYLVLLSGSEYPLRSKEYIQRFLETNCGIEFMTIVRMPNKAAGKPISRINTLRIRSHRPVYRTFVRMLAKFGLAQRDHVKYLGNLKPYAGNTWWTLTREACEHLVDFEKQNPHVTKYFEECFAPEEMYFHTILGNSPFGSRMRRNLLYEDWLGQKDHPAMINEKHLVFFESQNEVCVQDHHGPGELLFARKFSDHNFELLERMDTMIQRKEQNA